MDSTRSLHSIDMGWIRTWLAIASWFCASAMGCALESKSLGEDSSASGSGSGGSDESEGTDSETGDSLPPATELWARLIEDVAGFEMSVATDGSVYVFGHSGYHFEGGDSGFYDNLWIGKFDDAGMPLWSLEQDLADGRIAAGSGGFALVTIEYGDGDSDLFWYDSDGELVWTMPLEHGADAIAVGPNDLIVVTGYRYADNGNQEGWAAAFDGGVMQWEAFYGDTSVGDSLVHSVTFPADGDIVLGGRLGLDAANNLTQGWLAKIDPVGGLLWQQTVTDGTVIDWIADVDVTSSGTIHAVVWDGYARSIQAFDPAGATLWSWAPTQIEEFSGIAVAEDGSFVLTDGEYPDEEIPGACPGQGPCPSALRAARYEADRVPRWFDRRDDCRTGIAAGIRPDDSVLVLGACPPDIGAQTVAMGLFAYAP